MINYRYQDVGAIYLQNLGTGTKFNEPRVLSCLSCKIRRGETRVTCGYHICFRRFPLF
jgi:hypothetical protein